MKIGNTQKKCSCEKIYAVNFILNLKYLLIPNLIKVYIWCFCSAESVTLNDCLQLSYLPSKRNYMLLLYPREILILDLEVNQTVGVIAIERTGVPFLQVRKIRLVSILATVYEDRMYVLDPLMVVFWWVLEDEKTFSSPGGKVTPEPLFNSVFWSLQETCFILRCCKSYRCGKSAVEKGHFVLWWLSCLHTSLILVPWASASA